MATLTATISLASADITSDTLSFSAAATLTNAGGSTGMSQTTGLCRKNITFASAAAIEATTLYRADDYTANGANKVYIKNCSTTATEYITVSLSGLDGDGLAEVGRLYSGDWAFLPWNAVSGDKETFTATLANAWDVGDTVVFDGVTVTAANNGTDDIATQIAAAAYPNWTATSAGSVVTFVSKTARADLTGAKSQLIATTAGSGTATTNQTQAGTRSASDIYVTPSVHTGIVVEHILFHE